jgi:hypothetical protein
MKTTRSAAMFQLVAAGLLLLVTGCETVEKYSLTYRLWDNGDLRKWSEPAPNPNLALFEATQGADVLVQYDAISEQHSAVRRRSYYLQQNAERVAAGKRPKWIQSSVPDRMRSIPVLLAQGDVSQPPAELPSYAALTNGGRAFTLYRPLKSQATFDFPVYAETSGTPTRIVFTPLAVAGDTVMVGVVAAVVGFFVWLHIGAPTH